MKRVLTGGGYRQVAITPFGLLCDAKIPGHRKLCTQLLDLKCLATTSQARVRRGLTEDV